MILYWIIQLHKITDLIIHQERSLVVKKEVANWPLFSFLLQAGQRVQAPSAWVRNLWDLLLLILSEMVDGWLLGYGLFHLSSTVLFPVKKIKEKKKELELFLKSKVKFDLLVPFCQNIPWSVLDWEICMGH